MSSFRKQQIESTLKRAIAKVLQQLADPRVEGMVTVTAVDVAPDLTQALVHVSILPEKFQKKTIAGLRHAAGHVYSLVCKEVALKTVPKLDFRLDESLKKEAAVFAAIRRGVSKEKPLPAEGDAGSETAAPKDSTQETSSEEDQEP